MKVVMLMFDSLNRHLLGPYNPESFAHAPNFQRLADRCVTFDRSYVCSMPCMPARRDFHTGRPNFLHNSWGPLEPFDDSVPQMLRDAGVYTHLATDHYHYFEDGGATYHGRYNSWEFFRGQENDIWIGQVAEPAIPDHINGKGTRANWVNRPFMQGEANHSQTKTIDAGLTFIDRNAAEDNWFLQVECFDPHEPFFSSEHYQQQYPTDYDGPLFDWPGYREVTETPAQVAEARRKYAALLSQCDANLGRLLDAMDRHNLWDDTMFVVWTDHGYLLGEHNCWAKNWMPLYEQIAHTPFFVWDPRSGRRGERCDALVQPAIDLGPTLLRCFGLEPTRDMLGRDLADTLARNTPVRDAAIFGYHSQAVNVTDGRYVYMRNRPQGNDAAMYRYTLMPLRMRGFDDAQLLADAELAKPFSFTKRQPLLKIGPMGAPTRASQLWDVQSDPEQESPLTDAAVERRMSEHLVRLMREADAPAEQYARLGL